jgi:hypothetical protein
MGKEIAVEMIPVNSAIIREIGYEPKEQRLTVVFNSGGRYTYDGVSLELWGKFLTSKSKGRFFAEEIKHNHRFRRSEAGARVKAVNQGLLFQKEN